MPKIDLNEIKKQIGDSAAVKKSLLPLSADIERICSVLVDCLRKGNKILIAGNGGSAADSQHMAGELVGRFKMDRKALPCVALTTDSSVMTAWANDKDFSTVFERQIEGLGKKDDALIAISTSGNSDSIINAVSKAEDMGLITILLLGKGGGKMKEMGDYRIIVPSSDTPRIQESHILIIHILCDYIEHALFSAG